MPADSADIQFPYVHPPGITQKYTLTSMIHAHTACNCTFSLFGMDTFCGRYQPYIKQVSWLMVLPHRHAFSHFHAMAYRVCAHHLQ